MLWTMILATAAVAAVFSSIGAAHAAGAGVVGYAAAILIGATVGSGSAWMLNRLGDVLYKRWRKYPERQAERRFRAMYLAAAVWVVIGAFLAGLLTSAAISRIK